MGHDPFIHYRCKDSARLYARVDSSHAEACMLTWLNLRQFFLCSSAAATPYAPQRQVRKQLLALGFNQPAPWIRGVGHAPTRSQ